MNHKHEWESYDSEMDSHNTMLVFQYCVVCDAERTESVEV